MTRPILEVRGLSKAYRGLKAISDVEFAIPRGSIYGLIGPNGAGKSTLFNLITGYTPPTAGSILFNDVALEGVPTYKRNRMGVARAFQISKPFSAMTIRENVRVGALFGRPEGRDVTHDTELALETVGITHLADRYADGLDIGTLRKVEVARAIATRPLLLLADEPCAGLNPFETEEMIRCLRRVRDRGATIWLVEHDMRAVTSICERILVLDAGRKIAEGTPRDVVDDPVVIAAYLGRPLES